MGLHVCSHVYYLWMEKKKIIEEFKETISHANALGFQVLVDISPSVLNN